MIIQQNIVSERASGVPQFPLTSVTEVAVIRAGSDNNIDILLSLVWSVDLVSTLQLSIVSLVNTIQEKCWCYCSAKHNL